MRIVAALRTPPGRLLATACTFVLSLAASLAVASLLGGGEASAPPDRGVLDNAGAATAVPQRTTAPITTPEADPNFVVSDAFFFSEQWALYNFGQVIAGAVEATAGADVRAPEAWAITRGIPEVVVAVIDSGIDYHHPDLAARLWKNPGESGGGRESNGVDDDGNGLVDDWRGWNYVDGTNDPLDALEGQLEADDDVLIAHGTAVSSVIAASGGLGHGVSGIAPEVRLMPLLVISGGISDQAVADAIAYSAANGVRIVNLSMGTISPAFGMPKTAAAIEAHPDVLFVIAAGNSGLDNDFYEPEPCASPFDNIICVGASDQHDVLWDDSNFGVTSVHVAAPGTNILVAQPAYAEVWSEGFETPIEGRWVTGGTSDTWGRTDEAARSGSYSLADSPRGEYAAGAANWARLTEPVDLRDEVGWCQLEFSVRADPAAVDGLFLLTSEDGERFSLRVGVDGFSLTRSTDGEFERFSVALRSGDLTWFGFQFRDAAASGTSGGYEVDDISVRCPTTEYAGREYGYAEGTSVAAPLVAGVAALVWSEHPDFTYAQVRRAILDGADRIERLRDVVQEGRRLNAHGALLAAEQLAAGDVSIGGPASSATPAEDGGAATEYGKLQKGMDLPEEPGEVPQPRGGGAGAGTGSGSGAGASGAAAPGGADPRRGGEEGGGTEGVEGGGAAPGSAAASEPGGETAGALGEPVRADSPGLAWLLSLAASGALTAGMWRLLRPTTSLSDQEAALVDAEIEQNERWRDQRRESERLTEAFQEAERATVRAQLKRFELEQAVRNGLAYRDADGNFVLTAHDGSYVRIDAETMRLVEWKRGWAKTLAEAFLMEDKKRKQKVWKKLQDDLLKWTATVSGASTDSWADFDKLWKATPEASRQAALEAAERWYNDNPMAEEVAQVLHDGRGWGELSDAEKASMARLHGVDNNSYWKWWADYGAELGQKGVNVAYDPYRWVTMWQKAFDLGAMI